MLEQSLKRYRFGSSKSRLTQSLILPTPSNVHRVKSVRSSSKARSRPASIFGSPDGTALAKMSEGDGFWHRMGDTGYLDDSHRLWFCGRKAHIVFTPAGPLFSVRCEAIFNQHHHIYRCALVGMGDRGSQTPAIVAEPEPGRFPESETDMTQLRNELLDLGAANDLTKGISRILFHRSLPVDTRHNVKINREALSDWACRQ